MRRPWILLTLGAVVFAPVRSAAPGENWVLRTFTDKEGYLTGIFRGSEVRPLGPNTISVTDLNITTWSGEQTPRVESVLLAPLATFFEKERRATGDQSVRLIRDDLEASSTAWVYEHDQKRVTLEGRVHIVLNVEVKDLLK
jgi:hypothetical protein